VTSERSPLDHQFSALQRFVRRPVEGEICELCSAPLGGEHQHLVDPVRRALLCACDACAILFSERAATKYRRVPRRVRILSSLRISDGQWDALAIPIGLAFLFYSSPQERVVAFYPSPAGATESLLPLGTWNDLVAANAVLREMEPDVEALLVNRVGNAAAPVHYMAPIDACYRLVGIIRAHWRGFSGGAELWEEVRRFFRDLDARAEPVETDVEGVRA
jgi:hypothetical protein